MEGGGCMSYWFCIAATHLSSMPCCFCICYNTYLLLHVVHKVVQELCQVHDGGGVSVIGGGGGRGGCGGRGWLHNSTTTWHTSWRHGHEACTILGWARAQVSGSSGGGCGGSRGSGEVGGGWWSRARWLVNPRSAAGRLHHRRLAGGHQLEGRLQRRN